MDKKFSGYLPYDFLKFVYKTSIAYFNILKRFLFNRHKMLSTFQKSGLGNFIFNNYKLDTKYWINILVFFLSLIENIISFFRFFLPEIIVFSLFYFLYIYGFFVYISSCLAFNIVCDFWVLNYGTFIFYAVTIPGAILDYISEFLKFFLYGYFFPLWNLLISFDVEWLLALLVLFIFSLIREAINEAFTTSAVDFSSTTSFGELAVNKAVLNQLITVNKLFVSFWFFLFNISLFYVSMLKTNAWTKQFVNNFLKKQYLFQFTLFNAISSTFSFYLVNSTLNFFLFHRLSFFIRPRSSVMPNLLFLLKNIKRNSFSHWFLNIPSSK